MLAGKVAVVSRVMVMLEKVSAESLRGAGCSRIGDRNRPNLRLQAAMDGFEVVNRWTKRLRVRTSLLPQQETYEIIA
jgi:S-adenosylhomocysteine hydrolase